MSGSDFPTAQADVQRLTGRLGSAVHPNGSGQPQRRIAAIYDYRDESGTLKFQTVRYEPKDFRQRQPHSSGKWTWNLRGVALILYNLPALLDRPADIVFVCEGEKDAEALIGLGLLATCNPMGAGKWRDEYAGVLRGRTVVILPDDDPAQDDRGRPHYKGQKHAASVAESLLAHECEVRIIELPNAKDAADWIASGGAAEQIAALLEAQPPLTKESIAAWRSQWGLPSKNHSLSNPAPAWPVPLAIQSELPPVEKFASNLLPAAFRPLALDIAGRMQTALDCAAVILVLALAGVVNRRAVIQPKANDTSWIVVPNLWGGIIAPPGFMKSPVIQSATRPLVTIQNEWQRQYQDALELHQRASEEYELRCSAWREEFKKKAKAGHAAPERPSDCSPTPKLRRLIINDATFEALHQTMSENPAGVLVIRDELTGWWSALDRQGREGERAFCLQAWNGDTGHTIDRIGRGSIYVEACCMSMLGGIQPARLRSYLVDALRDGASNDGLIQRFQLLVWPDAQEKWTYVDRPPNADSQETATRVFRELVELNESQPTTWRFCSSAQRLFIEWLTDLEGKVKNPELHPALISHLSKYRSLMPALALLFELADRAADGEPLEISDWPEISPQHADQAVRWCVYLESHARRIYSCVTSPHMRGARELAAKIKTHKVGAEGSFTCREIYMNGWSGLDNPDAARSAALVLEDAGWIREVRTPPDSVGGRPSVRYEVNPRVFRQD